MTVSGVTSDPMTANELYMAAFNALGVAQEGEPMTPRMYNDAKRAANMLIKQWNAHPRLWIKAEGSVAMVAGQAAYALSPQPLRVLSVRRRLNGIDTPLGEYSRQEYFDQPNKTQSPSVPVNFYFDPQVGAGTLYLWPSPSAQTVTQYSINYTYVRRVSLLVNSNDTLDMPEEWQGAFTWNLAKWLMTQYPVNDPALAQIVLGMAQSSYDDMMNWDNEPASIYLQPDFEGMRSA